MPISPLLEIERIFKINLLPYNNLVTLGLMDTFTIFEELATFIFAALTKHLYLVLGITGALDLGSGVRVRAPSGKDRKAEKYNTKMK